MNLKYQYPGEVIDADLPVNANVVAAVTTTTEADNERLAKLFSAAPDLLAALSDAAHDIAYVVAQPWSKRSQGDTDVLRARLVAMRTAIEKATVVEQYEDSLAGYRNERALADIGIVARR